MGKGGDKSGGAAGGGAKVEMVWREEEGKSVFVPKFAPLSKRKAAAVRSDVTMAEVAGHNTKDDVWVIVDGKAYDVTPYVDTHPGGWLPIADMAGKDCTDAFANYHPARVYRHLLPAYLVGDVADYKESDFQRGHRALRQKLLEAGAFETRPSYYLGLGLWLAFLLGAALALTLGSEGSRPTRLCGAAVMGLFFQQTAFLGHDVGHNAITHRWSFDNNLGLVVGNLLTGISMGWWKRSHNVHHLVCNSIEHDPDIQHMPIFAVDPAILKGRFWTSYHRKWVEFDGAARLLVSHQHWLFYPVMALARFNLYAQSWILLLDPSEPNSAFGGKARGGKARLAEVIGLLGFAGWFFVWLVFTAMPVTHAGGGEWSPLAERACYLLCSHALAGVLHVQICLSHFSMATYHGMAYNDDSDEWFRMQVATTMNIDCPWYLDWFHGGLQFQVEHHLWPRMPRHNLRAASAVVKAFCDEHGVHYHMPTWLTAQAEMIAALKATALEARTATKGDGGLYTSPLWDGINARG